MDKDYKLKEKDFTPKGWFKYHNKANSHLAKNGINLDQLKYFGNELILVAYNSFILGTGMVVASGLENLVK